MAYQLQRLTTGDDAPAITPEQLRSAAERLMRGDGTRFRRLWAYYRNPMKACQASLSSSCAQRPYRQAQEWGLPSRITGQRAGAEPFLAQPIDGTARKEIVIENDIGWRIETMVDYLFGRPLVIRSAAPDENRRALIDKLIRAILSHNGGILFLQQLALMGAVYGFVDVLVKLIPVASAPEAHSTQSTGGCISAVQQLGEPPIPAASPGSEDQPLPDPAGPALAEHHAPPTQPHTPSAASTDSPPDTGATNWSPDALIQRIARMVRLEIVEPARALPLLCPGDYRVVRAYAQCYFADAPSHAQTPARASAGPWWQRFMRSFSLAAGEPTSASANGRILVTEIIAPRRWQRYEDEMLVAEGDNSLGEIPLAHIRNTAVPFEYAGASDVEPLVPLQDELNTRLSDRANRIALQSFKMYLGKGIDQFLEMPVSPGRMWTTDNEEADVIEFGGDAACPSEDQHIADLREALDKTSGVSPIAAGVIKNRVGRLTSAAALRLTLISLLAKTDKKRTTYGLGLQRMIELALAWLDRAGVFATAPAERRVELHWPSPLPENALEKLQEAEAKARLGVPRELVLKELGY